MNVLAVLTCPTRPHYLAATLASLDAAGSALAGRRLVLADGPGVPETPGWEQVVKPDGPSGCRAATWWGFGVILATGADQALWVQDDMEASEGSLGRIFGTPILDRQAIISFFDRKEFPGARRMAPGIHDVPIMGRDGRGLFSACCLWMKRPAIEWLHSRPHNGWGDPWPNDPEPDDLLISWALRESPWKVRGVSVPSEMEHRGDRSSMRHARGQRAALYRGSLAPRGGAGIA